MVTDSEIIGLFINADNAPAKKSDKILSELARHGVVNIWKLENQNIKAWEDLLHEFAIQQFDLTKAKNATNKALVNDVMDLPYPKDIDVICLVSNCDFTPLVTRSLSDGKFVISFGERKALLAFVNSCSRFLYWDDEATGEQPVRKNMNIKGDTKLINLLRQAIEAVEEEDSWAMLGPMGTHISNHTSFDQRNNGYKKVNCSLCSY